MEAGVGMSNPCISLSLLSSPQNQNQGPSSSSSCRRRRRLLGFPFSFPKAKAKAKGSDEEESDVGSDSSDKGKGITKMFPLIKSKNNNVSLSLSPLSKDDAMGLVLSAATGRGWTTGSGMEGPPEPATATATATANISTFPWSLFTKSPRRRMLISFTCNICTQRTTRAINPHAYTDGTVFVQCCGCNAYHKLVDNLNLFDGMTCYINSSFKYGGDQPDVNIGFRDVDNDDDNDDGGFFAI